MRVEVRIPDLSVEQAIALLDVLDALSAAVVRDYGEAIRRRMMPNVDHHAASADQDESSDDAIF